MIRVALAASWLVLVGACFQTHDGSKQEIRSNADCYVCHAGEYAATGTDRFPLAPLHEAEKCGTACADCHTTTTWTNGLGGCNHPETDFPIASGAHDVRCLDCHKPDLGSSVDGANTDCISCHPNDAEQQDSHVGQVGPQGQAYQYQSSVKNFCLVCHPNGRANKHPEDRFPLTIPHNKPCTSCHDQSVSTKNSKANASCASPGPGGSSGCHSKGETDGHHSPGDVPQYMYATASCLSSGCHPNGRR